MRHLDDGTLRRLVDEPFAVSSIEQQHYENCTVCQGRGASIRNEARSVADVLVGDDPPVQAADAFDRFSDRIASAPQAPVRYRVELLGRRIIAPIAAVLAAAAVLLLFAFTPIGTLAQNFLTIFEPKQFAAIGISKGELDYLPDLTSFGTMVQHGPPAHQEVASAARAASMTGVPLRLPTWVPASVPRTIHYGVGARAWASFTFSAAKARAYAAASRRPIPPMPRGLDGSVLTLQVGPMVVIGYGQFPQAARPQPNARRGANREGLGDLPPLVIVESVTPRVTSSGTTAMEIESYLLQMPGVAPQLADQIRAIGDPSTTMPIPIPIDKSYAQDVVVDGAKGLAIGDDTGVGGMIVWQKNGIVYGVGGALPQRELMQVAQSLR
jgi:hypothetical protein